MQQPPQGPQWQPPYGQPPQYQPYQQPQWQRTPQGYPQPPYPSKPPKKKRIGLWITLGIVAFMLFSCGIFATGFHDVNTTPKMMLPTPTVASTQAVAQVPTLIPTVTPTQQPRPTVTPTHRPSATPTAIPTKPTPKPTSKPTGINGNPYGYDFRSGNLIYNPPSGFCGYFNCIPTFVEPDDPGDGYVVECSDGAYSQSGGERGACSRHGGVQRPLYSH